MELTKSQIQKISTEAMKVAMDGFRAAYPEATSEERAEVACVVGPVAAAIVTLALKEQHGEAITTALLGKK